MVYEDALTTAATTSSVSVRNAYAQAVSRWAVAEGGAYSAYEAAQEAARAARDIADLEWYNGFMKDMHAADAAWVLSVIPAWTVYNDEVSDHAEAWTTSAAPAWQDYQNAVADADEEYTIRVAPLSIPLAEDLGANYEQWVSDNTAAEQAYGNTLAANHITWVTDATAAGEAFANDTITSWVTYEHAVNGAKVTKTTSISVGMTVWTGAISGQLNGTPVTPSSSSTSEIVAVGVNDGTEAAATPPAEGNPATWYKPWTWFNPWFNQANLDEEELKEYEEMIAQENQYLDIVFQATGVRYNNLEEVPDAVWQQLGVDPSVIAGIISPRNLEQAAIAGGARANAAAEGALYVAAAADAAAGGLVVYALVVGGGGATLTGVGSRVLPNTLNHIFGTSALVRHKLEALLANFGGNATAAFTAVEAAAINALASAGTSTGAFEIIVTVAGSNVTVRGKIVDGIVRISTFFIP